MSRAFVKESDGADVEEPAELKLSPHRNLVTAEGMRQIEGQVERLRAELAAARLADDRAATKRIQRDLRYWSERQRTAEPIAPTPGGGKVRFGSEVVLATTGGGEAVYRIVGEDEADPANGKISYVSPIARQLIGLAAGDQVSLPNGAAEVVEVR